jgi:hypothetical protein
MTSRPTFLLLVLAAAFVAFSPDVHAQSPPRSELPSPADFKID